MTKRAEIKATILAAAAAFEQCPGLWCQGLYHRWESPWEAGRRDKHGDRDRYCAHGIVCVMSGNLQSSEASKAMRRGGLTEGWNDQPGRTVSEVVAKMREIAGKL